MEVEAKKEKFRENIARFVSPKKLTSEKNLRSGRNNHKRLSSNHTASTQILNNKTDKFEEEQRKGLNIDIEQYD